MTNTQRMQLKRSRFTGKFKQLQHDCPAKTYYSMFSAQKAIPKTLTHVLKEIDKEANLVGAVVLAGPDALTGNI